MTGGVEEATGTPRLAGEELAAVGPGNAEAAAPDAAASTPAPEPSAIDLTRFAHASEAEMARILDFYEVRWEYEPQTFPILWNLDGDVVESFAPDFYLPELGVFLEMTTLKQRLVRKKNRKLRRLRELYPDIRIKLFYARDFRAMMLKYGRLGLAESLSGTTGQVVPDRTPVEPQPVVEPQPLVPPLLATALAAGEPTADAEPVAVPRSEVPAPEPSEPSEPAAPREATRAGKRRGRRRAGVESSVGAEREARA